MTMYSMRILELIERKGYSYGELARLTGIPKSALQRYATGLTEKIPPDRIGLLAKALDCDAAYLMGWSEETRTPERDNCGAAMIPVYSSIQDAFSHGETKEYIPTLRKDPEKYIAAKVRGDRMANAGITDSSTVIIRLQDSAEDGNIAVCSVNGGEAELSRFKMTGGTVVLLAENQAYPPVIVPYSDFESGKAVIFGVAVEVIRTLV